METREGYRDRLAVECGRTKWIAMALLIIEAGIGTLTWLALSTLERVVWP